MRKKQQKKKTSKKSNKHSGRPSHPVAREKLLKVALTLFSKKGYTAVSIREIADKANVNTANISYHFGGKFGLYRELFTRILENRQKEIKDFEQAHKNSKKEKAICRCEMISQLLGREPEALNFMFRILLTETDKKIKNVITKEFLPPLCENIYEVMKNAEIAPQFNFLSPEDLSSFIISIKSFWFLFAEDFSRACPHVTTGGEIKKHSDAALKRLLQTVLVDDCP
ncbi:MAG: TetR family transcriptional regulator [Bdellovibrionales bacterium]